MSLCSFGVPVPTTSPQRHGAAHGPRHPECVDTILPYKLSCFVWFLFGLGLVFSFVLEVREKTSIVCILALQVPVLVSMFLWSGVLGSSWGVRCLDDFSFRATGLRRTDDDRL